MTLRPLLTCLLATWLVGCESLSQGLMEHSAEPTSVVESAAHCRSELPSFTNEACLLREWVDFGLASQRGDRTWRDAMLKRLEGEEAEQRLARAVALSWGNHRQWVLASELYKADLGAAPVTLQPLLRYWLNELERRRAMLGRLNAAHSSQLDSEARITALEGEKAALTEKLEALTAIERSINLRQQNEE
ncbi:MULTISPECIES: hypothetical protein [Halomonas]|uniref:YfhG lipoprotein n=2 Tax=Halomonas TaxID=2745 RepID=A0A7X4W0Q6_9GAMM|nr:MULTISPECIES: hypothetical protein [Halomonas]MDR5900781.1 hypothetical protein [Halomonas icarae]NAW13751.1 hypothetical protein [Halomonas icarae]TDB00436.1 hypothetical protein E0702_14395 [Halomonas marinisediminis]